MSLAGEKKRAIELLLNYVHIPKWRGGYDVSTNTNLGEHNICKKNALKLGMCIDRMLQIFAILE